MRNACVHSVKCKSKYTKFAPVQYNAYYHASHQNCNFPGGGDLLNQKSLQIFYMNETAKKMLDYINLVKFLVLPFESIDYVDICIVFFLGKRTEIECQISKWAHQFWLKT